HFPCINILSSLLSFCSHVTMTTQTHTLSLHDALPICLPRSPHRCNAALPTNRRVWAGSERLCARARSRQKIHARNKLIVLVPGRAPCVLPPASEGQWDRPAPAGQGSSSRARVSCR